MVCYEEIHKVLWKVVMIGKTSTNTNDSSNEEPQKRIIEE